MPTPSSGRIDPLLSTISQAITNEGKWLAPQNALVEQFQLPFDARKIATRYVSEAMMLQKEIALASAMTDTAVITQNTTLSGTSQWDDYNNSNPQDDIETGRDAVFSGTGLDPNFLEHVKGITALTPEKLQELMMRLFEIEHVFVAKSLKVTSKTGQTVTKGAVWGNDFVMGYYNCGCNSA